LTFLRILRLALLMLAMLALLALALLPGDILGIPLLLFAFLTRFVFPVATLALTRHTIPVRRILAHACLLSGEFSDHYLLDGHFERLEGLVRHHIHSTESPGHKWNAVLSPRPLITHYYTDFTFGFLRAAQAVWTILPAWFFS